MESKVAGSVAQLTKPAGEVPAKEAEQKKSETTVTVAPRITSFTGDYVAKVTRRVERPDPAMPTRKLTVPKILEGPMGLVLQYVCGIGKFPNTGEDFVTIHGQYNSGKTCRITVGAQNVEIVSDAILKDNVDKSSGKDAAGRINWPLKVEKTVTAFGSKMSGFALLVEELHLHNPDGTFKTIIGAPATDASQQLESYF